ncbi:hypothetical protein FA15DRAFT_660938 [Coprinopsis marcescibilis]|uniref:Uncharacterized protein n=1 Tax=Coprinopsis marcescibilis TaxID=230819 RepID=A0A5C3KDI4_COPMA|nr:hypothetical protein FA15DRAFT_660938 [Coprinopsis marcescibilis]
MAAVWPWHGAGAALARLWHGGRTAAMKETWRKMMRMNRKKKNKYNRIFFNFGKALAWTIALYFYGSSIDDICCGRAVQWPYGGHTEIAWQPHGDCTAAARRLHGDCTAAARTWHKACTALARQPHGVAQLYHGDRTDLHSPGTALTWLQHGGCTDLWASAKCGWVPETSEIHKDLDAEVEQACSNMSEASVGIVVKNVKRCMPNHQPLLTVIGVSTLALEGMRIEIEAVAHVDK